MKRILIALMTMFLLAGCGSPSTQVKVTLRMQGTSEDAVILGQSYTELGSGEGFVIDSSENSGIYFNYGAGIFEGPYTKVAFRSTDPGLKFEFKKDKTQIMGEIRHVWSEREVVVFYKDKTMDYLYPTTEPVLTETGIEFWSGPTQDKLCTEVASVEITDINAWHCVVNLISEGSGPYSYLYTNGKENLESAYC